MSRLLRVTRTLVYLCTRDQWEAHQDALWVKPTEHKSMTPGSDIPMGFMIAEVRRKIESVEICPACGGMGTITTDVLRGGTEHDTEETDCQTCRGTGIRAETEIVISESPG